MTSERQDPPGNPTEGPTERQGSWDFPKRGLSPADGDHVLIVDPTRGNAVPQTLEELRELLPMGEFDKVIRTVMTAARDQDHMSSGNGIVDPTRGNAVPQTLEELRELLPMGEFDKVIRIVMESEL